MKVCALMLAVAVAAAAGVPSLAQADQFPDKPIKVLVGFAAGGSTDLVARVVTQQMSKSLGQSIIVENRVGASGIIATEALAHAQPDGYTVGACSTSAFTILPYLMKSIPYDPVKDFQPIAQLGLAPYVLVANPRLNVKTLQDVMKLAKTKPNGLTFASGGRGSAAHLTGELFSAAAGIKMTHVPYKGLAQAMSDVISGQVDLAFDQEADADGNIRAGKLVPIAIASGKRSPTLPEVPTFAQAGVPLQAAQWIGLCGPAHMPKDRVDTLYRSAAKAVATPEVADRFRMLGVQADVLDPAAFGRAIDTDRAKWQRLITGAHITLE